MNLDRAARFFLDVRLTSVPQSAHRDQAGNVKEGIVPAAMFASKGWMPAWSRCLEGHSGA
jgi:hypothetical protein